MNLPENYDVKEINMGNISHIIYYENNLVSQERLIKSYSKFREIATKKDLLTPEAFAGPDLAEKSYENILIDKPKNEYEYLRSRFIAIPVTNNDVVSSLYAHYYFEDTPSGFPPPKLSLYWDPFSLVTEMRYLSRVTSPNLLGFIEACLNTKRSLGTTQDFESYGYLLLYYYLEHCIVLNQYTTYEQKGVELYRGDLLNSDYLYGNNLYNLNHQFIDALIPFILIECSDACYIWTKDGEISLAHDPEVFKKALEFLITRRVSLKQKFLKRLL
jgi:hypothetical protein